MSVQEVTYYRVVCARAGCGRDSAAQGFTAAFPTVQEALDDWIKFGGSVDPDTGVTLCNYCQPQVCRSCEEAPAVTTDEDDVPVCGPCARVVAG